MSAQVAKGSREHTISVQRAMELLKGLGLPHSKRRVHHLIDAGKFKAKQLGPRGWYAIDYDSFQHYLNQTDS